MIDCQHTWNVGLGCCLRCGAVMQINEDWSAAPAGEAAPPAPAAESPAPAPENLFDRALRRDPWARIDGKFKP